MIEAASAASADIPGHRGYQRGKCLNAAPHVSVFTLSSPGYGVKINKKLIKRVNVLALTWPLSGVLWRQR